MSEETKLVEARKEEPARKKLDVPKWLGLIGIPAIGAMLAALVMYWSTVKQVESANAKMSDLMLRIGAAQEKAAAADKRANDFEEQVNKLDAVVQQLMKLDQRQLSDVVATMNSPQMRDAAKLNDEINRLARNVATIYRAAVWTYEERRPSADPFVAALTAMWLCDPVFRTECEQGLSDEGRALREQQETKAIRAAMSLRPGFINGASPVIPEEELQRGIELWKQSRTATTQTTGS
jgi:polyhydroxyalkanoate synthesis regulator phasin